MLQGRRTRKMVAATLLTILLTNTFAPVISYALTSGPTAPEATSFEPVDTTDMVNLFTGGLTYNLPILEVPGPDGGYPISLSYHAGIKPDQEASWVGLGFEINPGAITRSVEGYPDDYDQNFGMTSSYWSGGVTHTLGVDLGVSLGASVSIGLTFAHDTYKGFSNGFSLGLGFAYDGFGIMAKVGLNPYGSDIQSITASYGIADAGSISVSTDGNSITAGLNVGTGMSSSLGISISSSGGGVQLNGGGTGLSGSVQNTKVGKISSETTTEGFNAQIWIFDVGYSDTYTRYWSDVYDDTQISGALYFPNSSSVSTYKNAFDTYRLLDPTNDYTDHIPGNIAENDPDVQMGGSFPAFDHYTVTAQGLGGIMRPYSYQGSVLTANRSQVANAPAIDSIHSNVGSLNMAVNKQAQFRFVNDFSNKYTQNADGTAMHSFDNQPVYGNNDGNYSYNPQTAQLAGSRSIQYYTIGQVNTRTGLNGFLGVSGYTYSQDPAMQNQIAAFTITNESGVQYHYSLPAYEFGDYTYSENLKKDQATKGTIWNSLYKRTGYAYTWYLTAITGPDYVPGSAQFVNDDDMGYHVVFLYGNWAGKYSWRNPSQGTKPDLDNNFITYSSGGREIYYLDAIRTRTHTAVFAKSMRADGKGLSSNYGDLNGSFIPYIDNNDGCPIYPTPSLKLSSIYLFRNDHIPALYGFNYNGPTFAWAGNDPALNFSYPACSLQMKGLGGLNIIDAPDMQALFASGAINPSSIIKEFDFNYDYSLCPNTANSFDPDGSATYGYGTPNPNPALLGKLTLNSVAFKGKGGVSTVPPVRFTYDLSPAKNPAYNKDAYDIWGYYKSDYVQGNGNDFSHITTLNSSANTDAWSLKSIQSSLGSTISMNYESNVYSQSLSSDRFILLSSLQAVPDPATGNKQTSAVVTVPNGQNITDIFKVGDPINVMIGVENNDGSVTMYSEKDIGTCTITSLTNGSVTFSNTFLANLYKPSGGGTGGIPQVANISVRNNGKYINVGDGIRVSQLSVNDPFSSLTTTTRYNYNVPGTTVSSGVTSYEPLLLGLYQLDLNPTLVNIYRDAYKEALFADLKFILAEARELPSPGVMYEYVTVSSQGTNGQTTTPSTVSIPGSMMYQFEVFRPNMVGIHQYEYTPGTAQNNAAYRNIALADFTASIGALKRETTYDNLGNKISEQINHYLYDQYTGSTFEQLFSTYTAGLSPYNSQGLITERYADNRTIVDDYIPLDSRGNKEVWSARSEFPAVKTSSTAIDYVHNTREDDQNLAFDFYSGAVTKSANTDAYGNSFVTVSTPAYRVYPGMGLPVNTSTNFNMLTQEAGKYVYQASSDFNTLTGLVSASVQTWDPNHSIPVLNADGTNAYTANGHSSPAITLPIIRKSGTYNWMPSGATTTGINPLTGTGAFVDYFATGGSANPSWVQKSQLTLTDVYSNQLESYDINKQYQSIRLGYDYSKVIMSGNSARYPEIVYCGAESPVNDITYTRYNDRDVLVNTVAHTGTNSLLVLPGTNGFTYTVNTSSLPLPRNYTASVWVNSGNNNSLPATAQLYCTLNGAVVATTGIVTKHVGSWYLMNLVIPSTALTANATLIVGCKNTGGAAPLYFDDFRFQPANAQCQAYVYDPVSDELTYILDNNNFFTKFEYDAAGRLIRTSLESLTYGVKVTGENNYNYGRP